MEEPSMKLLKRLFNPEVALLDDAGVFDSEGKLKLYHPQTQEALFNIIRGELVEIIKRDLNEDKKKKKSED